VEPVYDRILSADDPPGTRVIVIEDDGKLTNSATRSRVWMFHETPVVLLQGRTGAYLATRCRVVEGPIRDSDDDLPLFQSAVER